MQDAKEDVRGRLNIEDVIGEYVQLQRAGRNFRGLSPFTGEKTPSFYVSPEKNIWHDFSSNKGGDVFSFVMEVEGIGFREALEILARKAGVDLTIYESKGSGEMARLKKRLVTALDLSTKYYQQTLLKNPHALEYVFKKRGLNKDIVQLFKIGYAPSSGDGLTKFLKKKGYSDKELSQAGLSNRFGGDLFRGRMTVPLMDSSGQVIGFTARVVDDKDKNAPKYLNTPETILYNKGRHVFGLSQAKESIRQNNYSVLVEGNLDVISSHQAGISQVVATAGTALTENHLKALVRLSNNIRLAFDSDKAGLAATERAIPIAQANGVDLSIISLPGDFKDPDELIKSSPKLWQKAIDEAEPVIDWILQQHAKRNDLTTAIGKRNFTNATIQIVSHLKDSVEKEYYIQKISTITGASVEVLTHKLDKSPIEKSDLRTVKTNPSTDRIESNAQDNLLALVAGYPGTRHLLRDIDEEMMINDTQRLLVAYLQKNPETNLDSIPADLQSIEEYVKISTFKADTRYESWTDDDRSIEAARLVRQVITEHKQIQKDKLVADLRDAEETGDDVLATKIRQELNVIIKEINSAKK